MRKIYTKPEEVQECVKFLKDHPHIKTMYILAKLTNSNFIFNCLISIDGKLSPIGIYDRIKT